MFRAWSAASSPSSGSGRRNTSASHAVIREDNMKASHLIAMSIVAVDLIAGSHPSAAQQAVKIGIVGTMTGPFAVMGEGYRQGIDAFVTKYGTTPSGRKVEVLFRDSAASDSSASKRLTEELIAKDRVSLIGGLTLTPDVVSAAPVVNEAKLPTFIVNAATPALINMSPYFLRVGQNIAQPAELGAVYARQL